MWEYILRQTNLNKPRETNKIIVYNQTMHHCMEIDQNILILTNGNWLYILYVRNIVYMTNSREELVSNKNIKFAVLMKTSTVKTRKIITQQVPLAPLKIGVVCKYSLLYLLTVYHHNNHLALLQTTCTSLRQSSKK